MLFVFFLVSAVATSFLGNNAKKKETEKMGGKRNCGKKLKSQSVLGKHEINKNKLHPMQNETKRNETEQKSALLKS